MSTLLTIATVVAAVVLLRRDLSGEEESNEPKAPVHVSDWREASSHAVKFGKASAPLILTIFTDFECPFCRAFHENTLPKFLAAFPDSVGWQVVHFPLPMHRFARGAARVLECVDGSVEQKSQLIDHLYAKQDSFGLKPWSSFVSDAGIKDTTTLSSCMRDSAFVRIDSGLAVGSRFGVHGTPGIMLNSYLFDAPPSDQALIATARLLLANGNKLPTIVLTRK